MCLAMVFASIAAASQPIEIVVPVVPGGAVDMSARALSQALTKAGYDNVVVYKPGANNEIARVYTVEKRDNVITVGSSATFVFSNVILDRENQHVKDFLIRGPSLTNSMAFFAPVAGKFHNLRDLISAARDHQSPLMCGVSNNHGETLLMLMNKIYGTNFKPVIYKGTGQLIPDLIGAHIPCVFDQTAPYMRLDDRVRWLGVSGRTGRPFVPLISDVLQNFRFDNWYAAAVPKDGNLVKDTRLISLLDNWSQDSSLVGLLIEQDFVVAKSEDLNSRATKETNLYRTVKK